MAITVGIPTYNRARLLRRALESLTAQRIGDLVVIVSDNCSHDNTADVCRWAAGRLDITYLRQSATVPATENFLAVLDRAETDHFAWLADDDWYEPGALSAMAQALESLPGSVLAVPTVRYIASGGEVTKTVAAKSFDHRHPQVRASRYLRSVGFNGAFYGLRRRDVTGEVPLPDVLGGDWLHVIGLALRGSLVGVPGAVLNRSAEGISTDFGRLTRSMALGRFAQRHPLRYAHFEIARALLRGFPPLGDWRTARRRMATAYIVGPHWVETEFLSSAIALRRQWRLASRSSSA